MAASIEQILARFGGRQIGLAQWCRAWIDGSDRNAASASRTYWNVVADAELSQTTEVADAIAAAVWAEHRLTMDEATQRLPTDAH